MRYLFLIPARGGSKGVPKKNIKPLCGKPLIHYSIELAMELTEAEHICISTDDEEIQQVAEGQGVRVPFLRPEELAADASTSYDVIRHALKHYSGMSIQYDAIVLLQPTSPFRSVEDVRKALEIFEKQECDAVISVCEAQSNPYYVHFRENENGNLVKLFDQKFTRRQDVPKVYELNGAVYVLKVQSILDFESILAFPSIVKTEMPQNRSVDIDTPADWQFAEYLMSEIDQQ